MKSLGNCSCIALSPASKPLQTNKNPAPFGEALNKSISFMVRQTHHERNQQLAVHPDPVEELNQHFLGYIYSWQLPYTALGRAVSGTTFIL